MGCWRGCLEPGADLHMAQPMPLLLTISYCSKIEIGLPLWYRLTRVVPEKGPLNRCVLVDCSNAVDRGWSVGACVGHNTANMCCTARDGSRCAWANNNICMTPDAAKQRLDSKNIETVQPPRCAKRGEHTHTPV